MLGKPCIVFSNMTLAHSLCAEVKGISIFSCQQYTRAAGTMHGRGVNLPRPSGQSKRFLIIYQRLISSFSFLVFLVTSRFFTTPATAERHLPSPRSPTTSWVDRDTTPSKIQGSTAPLTKDSSRMELSNRGGKQPLLAEEREGGGPGSGARAPRGVFGAHLAPKETESEEESGLREDAITALVMCMGRAGGRGGGGGVGVEGGVLGAVWLQRGRFVLPSWGRRSGDDHGTLLPCVGLSSGGGGASDQAMGQTTPRRGRLW